MLRTGAAVLGISILIAGAPARAHDPFEITTDAHVSAGGVLTLHTTMSLRTASRACLDGNGAPVTAAEFALLDELTELIIPADDHSPGARSAAVAAFIDGRLAESLEPDWQAKWRTGLQAVDGLSRELHAKPFLEATSDQRVAVLARMAAAEQDPKTDPERFFGELKRWTVRGYYTSKIGIHLDQEYKGNVYQRGEFAGFDAK